MYDYNPSMKYRMVSIRHQDIRQNEVHRRAAKVLEQGTQKSSHLKNAISIAKRINEKLTAQPAPVQEAKLISIRGASDKA